jgi:ribosomal-protein-alanine N-acetyltransferase
MGEISFSALKGTDIEEILEIERVSFPTPWTRGMFMDEVSLRDMSFYLVAKENGRIAGYGGFWLVVDEAHLGNLAVHPDFRHRGIGERILNELIGLARSKGANLMTLEVRESNEVAKSLYEKTGFRMVAIRKQYYTDTNEDAYVYIMNL